MFCINLDTDDPFFNLALEEVFLRKRKEQFFILGVNSQSVIIGKHQCPHREVNTKFISENGIPVIRRITGGGTVYHDCGNVNFTFIMQSEPGKQIDFRRYTKPVIDFLATLGVEAGFEGKNDLKIDGLKISGNAEHVYRNRVLHHGTILFSASLDLLRNSIRKDISCYASRAVESNPSSVTNLKDKLPVATDVQEFRTKMMDYVFANLPSCVLYEPEQQDIDEAYKLVESKYKTWEWNWAYGPEYIFSNTFDFKGDMVTNRLIVREGTIRDCILEGAISLSGISDKLVGCRHMPDEMREVFSKENVADIDIFNFF